MLCTKEWHRNYSKEWYKRNKEIINKKHKEAYERNKEAVKKMVKKNRDKYNEQWILFFKELGYTFCVMCGYNEYGYLLEFHHKDKKDKKFNISRIMKYKPTEERKAIALEEIKKCILLCARCHKGEHARLRRLTD